MRRANSTIRARCGRKAGKSLAGLAVRHTSVLSDAALAEGRLTRARAGDVPVCLLRCGDRIFAVEEWCTHLGGPLAEFLAFPSPLGVLA